MAAQTVTTTINYDDAAIGGLNNGETITINGGSVTIDADVRWNQQAAVFGNLTCSATLGGNIFFDATETWEIAFDASTGNVPTQGALGANGVTGGTSGATGELTRVWATGSLTPATAGGAMPASGFIKLRSKTGTFQDNEIITLPGGATVTVNSATGGKRSWIHVVGANTFGITLNRLNKWQCRGDWYELGETDGTDDQTFQFPVADNCSGIQIETAAGSGVYEWYPNVHYRWGTATQFIPTTDGRGKFCGQDVTTGVITIARRATNACGFKPPSGCKVRVPNIILSNSSSADWDANILAATLAIRYETTTTGLGEVDLEYVSCNWYLNLTSVYNFRLKNSTWGRQLVITTPASPIEIENCCSGCDISDPYTSTVGATNGLLFATNYQGATVNNCRITHSNAFNGAAVFILNFTNNLVCTNSRFDLFGGAGSQDRNNATNPCVQATSLTNSRFENCQFMGGRVILSAGLNLLFKNIQYCDKISGATNAVFANSILTTISSTTNLTIDGLSWFEGLTNVYTNTALFALTDTLNVIVRNIGTKTVPLVSDATLGPTSAATLTNARNVVLQRIYCDTFRTSVLTAPTTAQDIKCYDLRGAYANAFTSPGFNVDTRGAKATATAGTLTGARGIHWRDGYTSATAGFIRILGIEPTNQTANQVSLTLNGAGGWTGTGNVAMPSLGDECVWTQQYFALGHTGFSSVSFGGTNTGNFTFTFQYDTGSGWNGTWLTLDNATLAGLGAINPATGIKMKFRAVVATASSTNAINFISCITTSTTTAQLEEQPLVSDSIGRIENLESGSRIQIYNVTTSTELYNGAASGTTYDYEYLSGTVVNSGDEIRIRVAKLGYLPQTLIAIATDDGFSAAGNQIADAIYVANGIDGSTVTEFIADYPNIQVDISDPDQITTVQRVYAWLRYVETTTQGISEWFDAVDPTDDVNYEINVAVLDLKLDNTQPTPVVIGGGRLYRSDGGTIIATLSSSIQMDPNRVYQADAASLASDIWAFSTRTLTSGGNSAVASAVRTELTTELGRIDVAVSTRNATAPDNTGIAAIKAKTDNLPNSPASEEKVQESVDAANLAVALSA